MSPLTMYGIILVLVAVAAMVGSAVSPGNAIIILGFAGVIAGLIVIAMQSAYAAHKVAEKVEKVATVAAEQSSVTRHMANEVTATHTLVNSSYGASLRATLNALKLVESLTTGSKASAIAHEAVVEAQAQYDEHMASQAQVDSGVRTPVHRPSPEPVNIAEKLVAVAAPEPVSPVPAAPVTTITQSPGSMEVSVTDKTAGTTETITGDEVSVTSTEKPTEPK